MMLKIKFIQEISFLGIKLLFELKSLTKLIYSSIILKCEKVVKIDLSYAYIKGVFDGIRSFKKKVSGRSPFK